MGLPAEVASPGKPARLVSLDAYRGFIMLAMASSVGVALAGMAQAPPFRDSGVWQVLVYQTEHVPWTGCSFWDLIQPSFMFMVGVAMPFSYASRRARGDSEGKIFAHVILRSLILVGLGIFLSSNWSRQTNFTFVNVLTQIGLGYTFVFLLLGKGWKLQLAALLAILGGYWLLFFRFPLPGPDFSYEAVKSFSAERFSGWAAHWDKNANAAAAADVWFLNLFPRPKPFVFNDGGYQTLNFIPSMATMIFGLMAGELLRGGRKPSSKCNRLVLAGVSCLLLGVIVDHTVWPEWLAAGVQSLADKLGWGSAPFFARDWRLCPIVKRIWTPSWAVFSAGWTFLMLAGFFWVIDVRGYRRWAFPFVVVGMNSIAMYCMAQLSRPWTRDTLKIHLGQHLFDHAGVYAPLAEYGSVLLVFWLVCWWLYRQRIFIRI